MRRRSLKKRIAQQFQHRRSDATALDQGKQFLANASHELRTPITILRGFAETLKDVSHLSHDTLREIPARMVRTCDRLEKVVQGLLALSDVENLSKERFHRCDLVRLVQNSKNLLQEVAPNAEVAIHSQMTQALLWGDSTLLELAIFNLLENGVKYSPPPAKIELSILSSGRWVYLVVRDEGIGIPEKDLPYIFDRFYTVDRARSKKLGGTGLGLSIVKTIVEKHGGSISVESSAKGSAFTASLPLYEGPPP